MAAAAGLVLGPMTDVSQESESPFRGKAGPVRGRRWAVSESLNF